MLCEKQYYGKNAELKVWYNQLVQQQQQQQQQQHLLTQIIYKAMIHEYTEYKISKIEKILDQWHGCRCYSKGEKKISLILNYYVHDQSYLKEIYQQQQKRQS